MAIIGKIEQTFNQFSWGNAGIGLYASTQLKRERGVLNIYYKVWLGTAGTAGTSPSTTYSFNKSGYLNIASRRVWQGDSARLSIKGNQFPYYLAQGHFLIEDTGFLTFPVEGLLNCNSGSASAGTSNTTVVNYTVEKILPKIKVGNQYVSKVYEGTRDVDDIQINGTSIY
jgi:hypothetical protein